MDNSGVIAGGGRYEGIKYNIKNTIFLFKKGKMFQEIK